MPALLTLEEVPAWVCQQKVCRPVSLLLRSFPSFFPFPDYSHAAPIFLDFCDVSDGCGGRRRSECWTGGAPKPKESPLKKWLCQSRLFSAETASVDKVVHKSDPKTPRRVEPKRESGEEGGTIRRVGRGLLLLFLLARRRRHSQRRPQLTFGRGRGGRGGLAGWRELLASAAVLARAIS